MTNEKTRFELVETNFFVRLHCDICGGSTDKEPVLCEVAEEGPYKDMRICEFCLEAGKEKVDERLQAHIKSLEGYTDSLRSLVGRLEIPTFEEFQAAVEQVNKRNEEEDNIEGIDPRSWTTDENCPEKDLWMEIPF